MASVLFTRFLACSVGIGLLSALAVVTASSWSRFFAAKWCVWLWGILAACLCFPLTPGIPSIERFFSRYPWIMIGWLLIAILVFLFFVLQQNKFRKDVMEWGAAPANGTFNVKVARLAEELNMKCPTIYITAKVSCPTILGLGNPMLLLPHETYTESEFDIILRHEFYHYLHGHIPYKTFLSLVCALHWFNPAIWLMRQKADLDLESVCDDALLLSASDKTRKQYSDTILSVMQSPSRCKSPFSTHSYGSPEATGHRLVRLLSPPPKNSGVSLLCIAVVLSILSGTAVATTTARLESSAVAAVTTPSPNASSEASVSAADSSSSESSVEAISSEDSSSVDSSSTDSSSVDSSSEDISSEDSSSEDSSSEDSSSEDSSSEDSSSEDSSSEDISSEDSSSEDSSSEEPVVSETVSSESESTPEFPYALLQAVQETLPDVLQSIQQPARAVLVTSQGLEKITVPEKKTSGMPSDEVFIQVANRVIDAYNAGTADTSMLDPNKPLLMPKPSSIESIPNISVSEDFNAIRRNNAGGYSIVVPIPDSDRQMQIWADDNGTDDAYSFDIAAVDFVAKS